MSGLPLVAAFEIDIKQFAAAEGVALGQTNGDTRANAVIGLAGNVALYVEVVWLVKKQVKTQVKRIAGAGGVTGREIEVDE